MINLKGGLKNMETNQHISTQTQRPIVVPRCVSVIDMLNIINDKLDYLIAKGEEKNGN